MAIKIAVDNEYPEELKKQLSQSYLKGGADYSKAVDILEVIFNGEGALSVDEIIISWWKETKEIVNRGSFITKLNNLAKQGHLIKDGRKYAWPED